MVAIECAAHAVEKKPGHPSDLTTPEAEYPSLRWDGRSVSFARRDESSLFFVATGLKIIHLGSEESPA
jgi:hypothetical protein